MSIIQGSAPIVRFDGALFDDDPEFLAEIVNLFLATSGDLLSAVEAAVSRKDAEALTRASHTLKGAVSNFGAESVVARASSLEIMGRNGEISGAAEAFANLRASMDMLLPELREALQKVMEKQVVT